MSAESVRREGPGCYNITGLRIPTPFPMPRFSMFSRRPAAYRGSALLASSGGRMLRVFVAVVFLWAMTGWAMGWWQG